ncbi:hypothetical protein COU59_00260 [Candidatus Pacearchaeota archaeon CG10_big_fil_rev_8_21_14_0_10_34_12]|nr:MAG: hypothetical protein COU59_00260 [Candidatus Pacearchaeota archaeon CG10_big_fil_rev_8_21_14_0_10_34_12]
MREKSSHIKKVFFTIMIAFAIVSFWRGTWGLMDLYLFPDNLIMSFSISIILGIFILYLTKNLIKKLI